MRNGGKLYCSPVCLCVTELVPLSFGLPLGYVTWFWPSFDTTNKVQTGYSTLLEPFRPRLDYLSRECHCESTHCFLDPVQS